LTNAISTIISGVLLSVGTRWGLLEHSWVVTKLMLTVGVITTAIQFDGRLAQQAMAALSALTVDDGTILGIASTPSSLLLALVLAHVLMLGTATVLSVYKPWGRTWFARCQAVPAWIDCPVSARARATPTHEPASQG
jgi:hypothetical protein